MPLWWDWHAVDSVQPAAHRDHGMIFFCLTGPLPCRFGQAPQPPDDAGLSE
jgi:hypothetical protein